MMMNKAEGDKNMTKKHQATINKRNSLLLTHLLFLSVHCQQGADFNFCFRSDENGANGDDDGIRRQEYNEKQIL